MPAFSSVAESASRLKCGWRREPGKRRTSARESILFSVSRARKASSSRVEWPMVQRVLRGIGMFKLPVVLFEVQAGVCSNRQGAIVVLQRIYTGGASGTRAYNLLGRRVEVIVE